MAGKLWFAASRDARGAASLISIGVLDEVMDLVAGLCDVPDSDGSVNGSVPPCLPSLLWLCSRLHSVNRSLYALKLLTCQSDQQIGRLMCALCAPVCLPCHVRRLTGWWASWVRPSCL